MVASSPPPLDRGITVAIFQHWIYGFTLQTLVYGINVSLFVNTLWILATHVIKGCSSHRFHRNHLIQNGAVLLYVIVMFALSTVFMGHQGMLTGNAWSLSFQTTPTDPQHVIDEVFTHRIAFMNACTAISILINWGTVGMLLWRAYVHWKIHSIFPIQIMVLPFLFFAACIATDLLHIIQVTMPASLSNSTRSKNWTLISWAMSTALYYLLAALISLRVLYHRHIIRKKCGAEDINKFTGYLSIFYDSGALLLPFATAHLVILDDFPNLGALFQAMVPQLEVSLSLLIAQRLSHGRAWTGKTIDCIMNTSSRKMKQDASKHVFEEVTTMGFNPNTEFSSTQNDDESERCRKGDRQDLTAELRERGNSV